MWALGIGRVAALSTGVADRRFAHTEPVPSKAPVPSPQPQAPSPPCYARVVILRIRSRARALAAAWLVAQIAIIGITVGALEALPNRTTLSGHCACPGSPETATCPMHGKSAPKPHHGDCAMRQGSIPSVAMLSASTHFPIASPVATVEPARGDSPVAVTILDGRDRSARPEAPPPRG